MSKIEEYNIETEDAENLCYINPIRLATITLLILIIIYIISFKK
jgi:hypothetical protein